MGNYNCVAILGFETNFEVNWPAITDNGIGNAIEAIIIHIGCGIIIKFRLAITNARTP